MGGNTHRDVIRSGAARVRGCDGRQATQGRVPARVFLVPASGQPVSHRYLYRPFSLKYTGEYATAQISQSFLGPQHKLSMPQVSGTRTWLPCQPGLSTEYSTYYSTAVL
jgi:hypothetical protein